MNLDLVTEAHVAAGVATHEQHGQVIPKFWAQGDRLRAVAEPSRDEGMKIPIHDAATLMTLMCDLTEARFIGRTAEAWIRTLSEGSRIPAHTLAELADFDPEVKTAIITQGFDLIAGKGRTSLRTFTLDEQAQVVWQARSEDGELDSWFRFCEVVQRLHVAPHEQFDLEATRSFAESCGWRLAVFA